MQLTTPPGVEPRLLLNARTDDDGRFAIVQVSEGAYLATFNHPLLGLLGLELAVRHFVLSTRGGPHLKLSTPFSGRLMRALCPNGATQSLSVHLEGEAVIDRDSRDRELDRVSSA